MKRLSAGLGGIVVVAVAAALMGAAPGPAPAPAADPGKTTGPTAAEVREKLARLSPAVRRGIDSVRRIHGLRGGGKVDVIDLKAEYGLHTVILRVEKARKPVSVHISKDGKLGCGP